MNYCLGIFLGKSSENSAFLCFLSCSFCPSLHETSQQQEQHLFLTEELFESMAPSSSFVASLFRMILSERSSILAIYWSPAAALTVFLNALGRLFG